jgi:DNA-directed RNA polymerase
MGGAVQRLIACTPPPSPLLPQITLDCLHAMFGQAKGIMHWLTKCARAVAAADHAVQWVTPLGLPVVQPYRRKDKHHVRTLLQAREYSCLPACLLQGCGLQ